MPRTDRREAKTKGPAAAAGGTVRVNLSLSPGERDQLDALAGRLARFGMTANRSAAVMELLNAILNAEALGLLAIEDRRIHLNRRPPDGRGG